MKFSFKFVAIFFVLIFSSQVFAFEIEDFSNSEWFDSITLDYIVNYGKPYNSNYDVVSFKFPKVNNSSDYNDWGTFSISGFGTVGAIYSVSKVDDKIIFEYGYFPLACEKNTKPEKEKNPYVCTIYVINENKITLINPPISPSAPRLTLHRKSFNDDFIRYQEFEDGLVNDLNVRIRMEPSTNGFVLGKLQTGDNVKIIKKSEISIADGKENYWYQVEVKGYPVCWIFGEYVTKRVDWEKKFDLFYR